MGEIFRYFLNECAEIYGEIIEANYYGNSFATIKVMRPKGDVLELTIKLEEKKDA